MKVLKTDWSAIADGTAKNLIIRHGLVRAEKDGSIWNEECRAWIAIPSTEIGAIVACRYTRTHFKALEDEN